MNFTYFSFLKKILSHALGLLMHLQLTPKNLRFLLKDTFVLVLGQLPPEQFPSHHEISPENNCHHSSKFLSKSTTSELRKTMHCLRVL